jgi:tryptophan 2,3-dioxygenase
LTSLKRAAVKQRTDLKKTHYADYLALEDLLSLQAPLSATKGAMEHDEMLFIIVHQTHELWFKQILFELGAILAIFSQNPISDLDLLTLNRRLLRILVIQDLLIEQLNVFDTMSPMGFLKFRDNLAPASGLQSVQFKKIEQALGMAHLKPTQGSLKDSEYAELLEAWQSPTLQTCLDSYLARMPYAKRDDYDFWQEYEKAIDARWQAEAAKIKALDIGALERGRLEAQLNHSRVNFKQLFTTEDEPPSGRLSAKALQSALFIFLYRHQPVLQIPYQILTSVIKLDENLMSWRSKHLLMAQRMIGAQMGSGGTTGVAFLESNLKKRAFSELTLLSSYMLASDCLPNLPEGLAHLMGFGTK